MSSSTRAHRGRAGDWLAYFRDATSSSTLSLTLMVTISGVRHGSAVTPGALLAMSEIEADAFESGGNIAWHAGAGAKH